MLGQINEQAKGVFISVDIFIQLAGHILYTFIWPMYTCPYVQVYILCACIINFSWSRKIRSFITKILFLQSFLFSSPFPWQALTLNAGPNTKCSSVICFFKKITSHHFLLSRATLVFLQVFIFWKTSNLKTVVCVLCNTTLNDSFSNHFSLTLSYIFQLRFF